MFKRNLPTVLFFKSQKGNPIAWNLMPSEDPSSFIQGRLPLFDALTGEERPRSMASLLLVLAAVLHLWLGLWLLKPSDASKKPEPTIMEVSLVSIPGKKAEVTPPAPPKPAPPKPEPPKKEPIKKKITPKKADPPKKTDPPKQAEAALPKPSVLESPSVSASLAPPPMGRPTPVVAKTAPSISSGIVPLERILPEYPVGAVNRHIEGWAKIEFTITVSGTVKDAVVVAAEPSGIFDEAALKAIKQWQFREKIVDGVAVEQRAVQTLKFNLQELD